MNGFELSADEWLYLPELQGRISDLRVGLSRRDGKMISLAQWTDRRFSDQSRNRFCVGIGFSNVALVLTAARVAVDAGKA